MSIAAYDIAARAAEHPDAGQKIYEVYEQVEKRMINHLHRLEQSSYCESDYQSLAPLYQEAIDAAQAYKNVVVGKHPYPTIENAKAHIQMLHACENRLREASRGIYRHGVPTSPKCVKKADGKTYQRVPWKKGRKSQ